MRVGQAQGPGRPSGSASITSSPKAAFLTWELLRPLRRHRRPAVASRPSNLPLPTLPGGRAPRASGQHQHFRPDRQLFISPVSLRQNQVKLGPAEGVMGLAGWEGPGEQAGPHFTLRMCFLRAPNAPSTSMGGVSHRGPPGHPTLPPNTHNPTSTVPTRPPGQISMLWGIPGQGRVRSSTHPSL